MRLIHGLPGRAASGALLADSICVSFQGAGDAGASWSR